MCTENYWQEIVETRHSHTTPLSPLQVQRNHRWNRRHNIPIDAPDWLVWKVASYPPGYVNRDFRCYARAVASRTLRNALTHEEDLDALIVEHRASRCDKRKWWY